MPATVVTETAERALDMVYGEALEPLVEMVVRSPAPEVYEARAVDGSVLSPRLAALQQAGAVWSGELSGRRYAGVAHRDEASGFLYLGHTGGRRWAGGRR